MSQVRSAVVKGGVVLVVGRCRCSVQGGALCRHNVRDGPIGKVVVVKVHW